MQETITVGLGERSYPISIGSGVLGNVSEFLLQKSIGNKYCVISDSNVGSLYGEKLIDAMQDAGISCEMITFPAGEENKNTSTVTTLASAMAERGFDRSDAIIALGGGVVGDISGFLASIFMRGIPFIQIPTSLLAQVDSSVGGKTGVDIPQGKNLVGTFYQPQAVFIDLDVLSTLPMSEYRGGLAEVIKYGVIIDKVFFSFLLENRAQILALDSDILLPMIRRCCEIKADVVEKDEREGGLRRILNFGHTIGHAVEAASGYSLIHGYGVSIGMQAVARMAVLSGHSTQSEMSEVEEILKAYELPLDIPNEFDIAQLKKYLLADKKTVGGRVFFVIPEQIGKVIITDKVKPEHIDAVLNNG
ncbi:MAG: 3-dehydroquinate synthase [Desulfobulbaceae bacterium]|nr:3-dehydroquinate synthase [Desulfobulbaceae bacterium]